MIAFSSEPKTRNIIDLSTQKVINCSNSGQFWYSNRYFKKCDSHEILCELLGTKLANMYELKSAQYEIAIAFRKKNIIYGVISDNVATAENKLFDLNVLRNKLKKGSFLDREGYINLIRSSYSNAADFEKFVKEYLKIVVIDYYMNQVDRCCENLPLFLTSKGVELAPILDYSAALDCDDEYTYHHDDDWYMNDVYHYENVLSKIDFPGKKMDELIEKYPFFKEYLLKLYDIDTFKIINDLYNEYGLNFYNINRYKAYDEKKKEHLKLVLKK